jgi:hypothetical protein
MRWMSIITVERLEALKPCYGHDQLVALVGVGVRPGASLKLLLALPRGDARWVLARLLDSENRARWARMAATRAARYAAANANAAAAANAAYANANANANAIYDEHKMACLLGLELLVKQERGS